MSWIGVAIKIIAFLCFVLLLWVGCASAATLVVSKTSSACTSGDDYYRSIQAAVDSADDEDEIVVCSGTYEENIEVDKSVRICSCAGASDTIMEAYDTHNRAFNVKADYVTIDGFTINYGWYGIFLDGVSHCNILNNIVSSNWGNGIVLNSSFNSTIKNNSDSNSIRNNTAKSNDYNGIVLVHSTHNIISNNTANLNGGDGIYLYFDSSYNIITANTANSNKKGIYLGVTEK